MSLVNNNYIITRTFVFAIVMQFKTNINISNVTAGFENQRHGHKSCVLLKCNLVYIRKVLERCQPTNFTGVFPSKIENMWKITLLSITYLYLRHRVFIRTLLTKNISSILSHEHIEMYATSRDTGMLNNLLFI